MLSRCKAGQNKLLMMRNLSHVMTMSSVVWIVALLNFGCVISQNVRLVPGPDKGRLEVLYNGTWGTVCYSNFKNQAASVICGSLNQSSNNAYWVYGQEYGVGDLKPRLSQVSCNGRETSLFDCSLTARSDTSQSCSTSYIVGIVCTDDQPTVKCEPEHIVSEGSKVNITCEVEANPSPHLYIWTDNSGDIIYRGSKHRLIIESVRPDNVGRYKCTALNRMEDSKGTFKSGVGLAELNIIIKRDQPKSTTPPSTEPPCQTSAMYGMIVVAVVFLVIILVLVVAIIKLRRKGADSEGPRTRIRESSHGSTDHQNAVFTESDYTSLELPDSNNQQNRR